MLRDGQASVIMERDSGWFVIERGFRTYVEKAGFGAIAEIVPGTPEEKVRLARVIAASPLFRDAAEGLVREYEALTLDAPASRLESAISALRRALEAAERAPLRHVPKMPPLGAKP